MVRVVILPMSYHWGDGRQRAMIDGETTSLENEAIKKHVAWVKKQK